MNEYLYSADLTESSEALAAEEMNFGHFYECIGGHSWSLQFDGEAVPRRQARHNKGLSLRFALSWINQSINQSINQFV